MDREGRPRTSLRIRFWQKVQKAGPDECWLWVAGTNKQGYGVIGAGGADGKVLRAHRLSYVLNVGPIPDGMQVCHTCDTPGCVNPRHLFLGTNLDNVTDRHTKGRTSIPHRAGSRSGRAKLNESKVVLIRHLHRQGVSQGKLAKRFSVDQSTISDIVNCKIWIKAGRRVRRSRG